MPSRTIYGLIAYLCQIAQSISSGPFDSPDPLSAPPVWQDAPNE